MPRKKTKKRRHAPAKGARPKERPPRVTQERPAPDPEDQELMKPIEGAVGDALKKRDPFS